ncbi:ATP-binding protein [Pendulispora albinea]|uniref:AAA family ATPase n=1 Tax=Pendulispora albinea TaxID=2741071 RepID=A0ABZ2LZP9_9BACT
MSADIHRGSEVSRLTDAIENAPGGLSIVAVSGPGGVGKTYLLGHVLETVDPTRLGYLTLRASAENPETRGDFFGTLEGLFPRSLPAPANPDKDYFPHLRNIATKHRKLVAKVVSEIQKRGAPESVQRIAKSLLDTGRALNTVAPLTKHALDVSWLRDSQVEGALDLAWNLLSQLGPLRESTALPGPLRDLTGATRANRLKRDIHGLTAAELRADLCAALVRYERRDLARFMHAPIPDLSRLLLVLDDYEAIQGVLEDFLTGAFVQQLAGAPFRTVLVVLGRDDLETTHPGWAQHCRRHLREQIRLAPFDEASALAFLSAAGIPEARWKALYESTQGYPYLLTLAVEEEREHGSDSVTFLQRFLDRTTRWMSSRERDWFYRVCYLDRVDEDTLRTLFPEEEVERIQSWFEKESSIRDPSATYFRVRPLIREKALRYLAVRAPSRHRELLARAEEASRAPAASAPPSE